MENVPPGLAITYRRVDSLKPHPRNARVHTKFHVNRIAASLREFGLVRPILISGDTVIAGHGVFEGAKLLGMTEVPTVQVDHLTADQIRAYMLADNKIAELSSWSSNTLASELQHLLSIEGSFDVTVTGFDVPEIDLILGDAAGQADKVDIIDTRDTGPAVTQSGQLWLLPPNHRLICADSRSDSTYRRLMAGRRASVVVADPPFNVAVDGHVSGKGRIKHREFAMASGEMNERQFIRFLTKALRLLATYSKPGSIHYIFMDWRHVGEIVAAGKKAYSALLNVCVWVKNNGGMGSFYRSQHELIFVFKNGTASHRNNIQLGKFGRNRTNIWTYPGANSFGRHGEESDLLSYHPTPKPVALIADALLDSSARGDIVLDSFLGSGSTLLAAERVGRTLYGADVDHLYVDLAIRRYQRHTGEHAVDAATGKRFDELAQAVEVRHD